MKGNGSMAPCMNHVVVVSGIVSGVVISLNYLWNHRKHQILQKKLEEKLGVERLPYDPKYSHAIQCFQYRGYVLPGTILENLEDIISFEARDDDIYVVSYPKSGTTWMQEIIYLVANDLDFQKAASEPIDVRFPYLESPQPGPKKIALYTSPRFIKSHLPYELLPQSLKDKKCKIIYVSRNPKDIMVSFFHFLKAVTFVNYKGTFEEFAASFLDDTIMYGPFWKHILQFWEKRSELNIMFVTYEDMKKDLHTMVRRITLFLDKHFTEDQITQIANHCSLENMRENDSINYSHWHKMGMMSKSFKFLRKGEIGDWKNYFTVTLSEKADEWIKEHTTGTGLKFEFSQ